MVNKVEGPHETTIMEIELQHAFTEKFWKKAIKEPVSISICVSHTRALQEGLQATPKKEVIIILEGDIEPTKNTNAGMAAFLANFFYNTHVQWSDYMA